LDFLFLLNYLWPDFDMALGLLFSYLENEI